MGRKVKDEVGNRFGRLTVVARADNDKHGRAMWACRCECGNSSTVVGADLRNGKTKSCGCQVNKRIDLTGKIFGKLSVTGYSHTDKHKRVCWFCKCECGKETIVQGWFLTSGTTKSCGCLQKELSRERINKREFREKSVAANTKHGGCHDRLYAVWASIKARTGNPNDKSYKHYGGRGITICDEWRHDFGAFRDWAMSHGYDPNAPKWQCTIDRIDNDKGYSPENCRWVDMKVQSKNKRNSKKKEDKN